MVRQFVDLGVSLFGIVSARAFALLSSVLIARLAGAQTFGEYSLFITIYVIATEVPNAIDVTFIRFSNSSTNDKPVGLYQSIALNVKLLYAVAIGLFAYFFSSFIAEYVFHKPSSSELVFWSLVSAAFISIHMSLLARFQQQKNYYMLSLVRPVSNLVIFISLLAISVYGISISSEIINKIYIYVSVPLAFLTLFVLIPDVYKYYGKMLGYITEFSRVASILLLSSVVTLIANRMDVFFITSYLDFESLGYYSVAVRLSIIVAIITAAMSTVYVPRASEAIGNEHEYNKYIKTMFGYSMLQTLFAFVIIWNIDQIIVAIFGIEYADVRDISIVLIFQVLVEAYARGFQALVQVGPKPKLFLLVSFFRLFLIVILLSYTLPKWGVEGAAVSVFVAALMSGLLIFYLAMRDCRPVKRTW